MRIVLQVIKIYQFSYSKALVMTQIREHFHKDLYCTLWYKGLQLNLIKSSLVHVHEFN